MILRQKYPAIQNEEELLKSPLTPRELPLMDTDNLSRIHIQIVSFNGIKTLKSIDDKYRKLRIAVAALLIKIHSAFYESHIDKLERMKLIVYSSRLTQLTDEKGIEKHELMKFFAENITSLEIGNDAEFKIIQLFNCAPFFDQTLLSSIHEQNPLILENDCELAAWLNREFSVKVLINEQVVLEEGENELCLIGLGEEFHASKDCRSCECNFKTFREYLRLSSKSFAFYDENDVSEFYDRCSKGLLFDSSMSPSKKKQDSSKNLCMSAESESPSVNGDPRIIKRPQKLTMSLFDDISFENSRHFIEIKSPDIVEKKTIKIRKSNNKKEESSIWGFLCCFSERK